MDEKEEIKARLNQLEERVEVTERETDSDAVSSIVTTIIVLLLLGAGVYLAFVYFGQTYNLNAAGNGLEKIIDRNKGSSQ